jgi:hypothetical protein
MNLKMLYAVASVTALLAVELAFAPEMRPELAFGLCVYFAFTLSSEETLYLFILVGLLKDSLSVERFGLFTALSAASFLFSRFLSKFFTTNILTLSATYILTVIQMRFLYGLHILLNGYSPEGVLSYETTVPAVLRGLALMLPVHLLLEEWRKERIRKRLYSEGLLE